MRVIDAARAFDNTECFDAYSGAFLFYGQLGLYDDSKRDSEASERRVLSCAPDVTRPSRGVVEAAGSRWILGTGNPDTYRGEVIRVGYVIHEAPHDAQLRTLEEFCLNGAGTRAWANHAWIKNAAFTEQSSKLTGQFNFHLSPTETAQEGDIFTCDGYNHIVRSSHTGPAGTLIVFAEKIETPSIEIATVQGSSWDPVTETASGTLSGIRMARLRWQSIFKYRYLGSPDMGPDMVQLAIAKATMTPRVGMKLTLSDGLWQINSIADRGVWLCTASQHT